MVMKAPSHPGLSVNENCVEALGLDKRRAADKLGVKLDALTRVLNGQSDITSDLAGRFEKAGWGNAEFWLRRQAAYNLAQQSIGG